MGMTGSRTAAMYSAEMDGLSLPLVVLTHRLIPDDGSTPKSGQVWSEFRALCRQ